MTQQGPVEEKRFRLEGELPQVSPHARRFRAVQLGAEREVEFRILPEGAPDEHRQLFERERDELILLDHPSFLPVLEVGESRERPFYVVPRREYVPIARRRKEERFSVEERCLVVRALAAAYSIAHQNRIVLGAVSPVLLAWDRLLPRLCFVHHRATSAVKALPLPEGAPENLARWTPIGDVFHWGYFAYWLITRGNFPYSSASAPQKPIRKVVPELASDLAQVIDASVSRSESLRPGHGLEIWAVLLRRPANRAEVGEESVADTAEEAARKVRESIDALRSQGDLPDLKFQSGIQRAAPTMVPDSGGGGVDMRLVAGLAALAFAGGAILAGAGRDDPPPAAPIASRPARKLVPAEDPFVRLLIKHKQVGSADFPRLWRIADRLRQRKRLPEVVGEDDRLRVMKERHRKDPKGAAKDLTLWIDDLREAVEGT